MCTGTYTTTCVVYTLVIMEAIDGLFSETIMRFFLQVQDYREKAKSNYKDHDLKSVTWNNIRNTVELPGLCQIIHAFS